MKTTNGVVADGPRRLLAAQEKLRSPAGRKRTFIQWLRAPFQRAPEAPARPLTPVQDKTLAHHPSDKSLW
jgi:hypothetical protein